MKLNYKKIALFITIAIAIEAICRYLNSDFLPVYLKDNILSVLITLMAINTATSTFIVSKLDEIGKRLNAKFTPTYKQIRLSLIEQIALIIIAVIILTLNKSILLKPYITENTTYFFEIALSFVFIYAIDILRDTGVAMFDILIQFDENEKDEETDNQS